MAVFNVAYRNRTVVLRQGPVASYTRYQASTEFSFGHILPLPESSDLIARSAVTNICFRGDTCSQICAIYYIALFTGGITLNISKLSTSLDQEKKKKTRLEIPKISRSTFLTVGHTQVSLSCFVSWRSILFAVVVCVLMIVMLIGTVAVFTAVRFASD